MSHRLPGVRFFPSDQQLLGYYLTNKNNHRHLTVGGGDVDDLIKELDLYEYEPSHLPEDVCFAYGCGGRKKHWYCYTKDDMGIRVLSPRCWQRTRAAKGGYWRRCGRVREVVGPHGKEVVGRRSKFVFYLGDSAKHAVRTDWVLHEYALVDCAKASFVLCRVFVKSRAGNSISDPDIIEPKSCDNGIDGKNNSWKYSETGELNEPATRRPVSVGSVQFPPSIQLSEQARTSEVTGNVFVDSDTALLSILEEDFIELDDLVDLPFNTS